MASDKCDCVIKFSVFTYTLHIDTSYRIISKQFIFLEPDLLYGIMVSFLSTSEEQRKHNLLNLYIAKSSFSDWDICRSGSIFSPMAQVSAFGNTLHMHNVFLSMHQACLNQLIGSSSRSVIFKIDNLGTRCVLLSYEYHGTSLPRSQQWFR